MEPNAGTDGGRRRRMDCTSALIVAVARSYENTHYSVHQSSHRRWWSQQSGPVVTQH